MLHISSGNVALMEDDIGIGACFEMVNAWSDYQAELVKGQARKFKLCAFFVKGFGPSWKVSWIGSKCKPLIDAVTQAADEVAAEEGLGRPDTSRVQAAFDKQNQQKREAASARARKALMERQEESAKKRKISLSSQCMSSPEASPAASPIGSPLSSDDGLPPSAAGASAVGAVGNEAEEEVDKEEAPGVPVA